MNQANRLPQTTTEAARLVGYSSRHVRMLCDMGYLPRAYKSGRIWLVFVDELLNYRQSKQAGASE